MLSPAAWQRLAAERAAWLLDRYECERRRLAIAAARRLGLCETDVLALGHVSACDAVTPMILSAELGVTSGGVSAVVERLLRRGYVARTPHPRDRRSAVLVPTDSAKACVELLYPTPTAGCGGERPPFTESEWAAIHEFLDDAVRRTQVAVHNARPLPPREDPSDDPDLWS